MQLLTLRDEIKGELELALESAECGNDVSDDLCDELGDYWEDVDASEDEVLQRAYGIARDGISCSAEEQVVLLRDALAMLA